MASDVLAEFGQGQKRQLAGIAPERSDGGLGRAFSRASRVGEKMHGICQIVAPFRGSGRARQSNLIIRKRSLVFEVSFARDVHAQVGVVLVHRPSLTQAQPQNFGKGRQKR
jgi:hypothetical protein